MALILGSAARVVMLIAALLLGACQASAPPARGPQMPAGSGPISHQEGFSAYCAKSPGAGTCP